MHLAIVIAAAVCLAWSLRAGLANKSSDTVKEFVLRKSKEAAENPVDRALITELVRMRKVYAYGLARAAKRNPKWLAH